MILPKGSLAGCFWVLCGTFLVPQDPLGPLRAHFLTYFEGILVTFWTCFGSIWASCCILWGHVGKHVFATCVPYVPRLRKRFPTRSRKSRGRRDSRSDYNPPAPLWGEGVLDLAPQKRFKKSLQQPSPYPSRGTGEPPEK